jgi:two-component system nitrate/nitrite response regulator NarP
LTFLRISVFAFHSYRGEHAFQKVNLMSIELVLADPHPVLLEGLSQVLQACPEFVVKACASTGDDALAAVQKHHPDVLVMDVSLAHRSGWAVLDDVQHHHASTRPVVFTDAPLGDVMRIIDAGVPGLVGKDKSRQELARCIEAVHAGQKWLDRDLTLKTMSVLLDQQKKKPQPAALLTPRELTVARMVTEGLPNKKIASKLFISEGTAKLHLHHIYQKLHCPGRMSLQRYMQDNGLM